MATIHYDSVAKIFWATSTYHESRLFSGRQGGAGWRFHGDRCAGSAICCKIGLKTFTWWTDDLAKARRLEQFADSDARAALAEVKAAVELSRAVDADVDLPCPDGLAYRPFQRAGIAYSLARSNVLIADEMGLGKTIQAIGVANADPSVNTILVLCPASLRINWMREMQLWLTRSRSFQVLTTGKDTVSESEVVIVNYDLVWRKNLLPQLMARQWDLLIADEVHYCKNARGAKRAKAVFGEYDKKARKRVPGLYDVARRRVFLTGTPMPNGDPMEAWPLLSTLAPETFSSWFQFAKRYAGAYQETIRVRGGASKSVWKFDLEAAKTHLPELQEKMRGACMVRRQKADVLAELPPKRRQLITLPTNGSAKAVAAEDKLFGPLKTEMAAAVAAGDYDRAVTLLDGLAAVPFEEMSAVRQELALAKVEAVVEHVEACLSEVPKLVVFAAHHVMIDALMEQLGPRAVKLDGRMAAQDRQASVDRFQSDPAVRVFVGQIQAAGVGLTLTAASHEVFAEQPWTPGDKQQAEDRCHRIGQTESVLIQDLVVDGSLDAVIAQLLVAKAERSDAALDAADPLAARADQIVEDAARRESARAVRREAEKTERAEQYPPARVAALGQGIKILAGQCDGAATRDGAGFNGADAWIGHRLAAVPVESWSLKQLQVAAAILPKYRRQLGDALAKAIG
jgi:SNF2-related domain/Helicase conserved C-terminal domain